MLFRSVSGLPAVREVTALQRLAAASEGNRPVTVAELGDLMETVAERTAAKIRAAAPAVRH